MFYNVLSCRVPSRSVLSCFVVTSRVILCFVTFYCVLSYSIVFIHVLLFLSCSNVYCRFLLYSFVSHICFNMFNLVVLCSAVINHVLSCSAMSCQVLPCPVVFCPVQAYFIICQILLLLTSFPLSDFQARTLWASFPSNLVFIR